MTRSTETELADCLERIERDEATADDALSGYSELGHELEPLVRLAVELRSMAKLAAPPILRGRKRPEFPDRLAPAPSAAIFGIVSPRRLWLSVSPSVRWASPLTRLAAAVAVAFLMLGGGVIASAGSLPEEPLYPVKLALEGAQLALTPNPQVRVDLEMQFAERRLAEAESAAEQGRADSLERGIALYEEKVEGALQLSQPAAVAAVDQGEPIPLQQSLDRQQEQLSRIYKRAPEPAQPAILHAMEVSRQGRPSQDEGKKSVPATPERPVAAVATPSATPKASATPTPTPTPVPTRPLHAPATSLPGLSGQGANDATRTEGVWNQDREKVADQRDDGREMESNAPGIEPTNTPAPSPTVKEGKIDPRDDDERGRKVDETSSAPGHLPSATSTPTPRPSATPSMRAAATATPPPTHGAPAGPKAPGGRRRLPPRRGGIRASGAITSAMMR